jgi:hypothetical protein
VQEPRAVAVEELSDEQLTLTMSLLCAQNIVKGLPRDPSAHAAGQSIRERVADLNELRNALAAVNLDACDPRLASLFAEQAPLADYMRGLYTWATAVLRALEDLANGLRVLSPDWATLRARLEDSAAFYLAHLERPIAEAATRLRLRTPELNDPRDPVADFDEHLVALFWAAAHLGRNLEERFG